MGETPAVTRFREYLRINTVQPNPDYAGAVNFLIEQANSIGLPFQVVVLTSGFPVVVITLEGSDRTLPSLLLNSHIDVVPVYPDKWLHNPFEAVKTDDGKIYARGSQDMKCVGMWHLEAVRLLKASGTLLLRTVHLSFVPDEEVGGTKGMKLFIDTPEFKKLNVGYALDEGICSPSDTCVVYYGERAAQWIKFLITGNPGHGSQFINNTAAEKAVKLLNHIQAFRDKERNRLEENSNLSIGDVTTVNVTTWQGGVQMNVIPSDITIGVDIRITPKLTLVELNALVAKWIADSGEGITTEIAQHPVVAPCTSTDVSDPWFKAFSTACQESSVKIKTEIFPAATDSRYLRQMGIPALGFTPAPNTPILLHDHNEYLEEGVYLAGIPIMLKIVTALANIALV